MSAKTTCESCGAQLTLTGKATVDAEIAMRCRCGYWNEIKVGPSTEKPKLKLAAE